MIEYVAGFLFSQAHVALVKKARPSWQAGKLNAIGGHVEEDESPDQAMEREFREETGLTIPAAHWYRFCLLNGVSNSDEPWRVYFFSAHIDGHLLLQNLDETEPVSWWAMSQLHQAPLMPNLNWLIPMAGYRADSVFPYDPVAKDWPYTIYEQTPSEHSPAPSWIVKS